VPSRVDVANHAIALEAFAGCLGFEAMALAGVLAFTGMFGGLAIAVALAVVHVVAMHFVIGGNGLAAGAFGGIGSKRGSRQGQQGSGQSKGLGRCRSHGEKSPKQVVKK
jgi:hypothetical protein